MNNVREKAGEFITPEKHGEHDPNFILAKQKFESRIKHEIDIYLPKLVAFTKNILQVVEQSGKTAVFIGRDARWLYYLAKIIGKSKTNELRDRLKFIDIGRDYVYGKYSDFRPHSTPIEKRGAEYRDYFRKLSIDINNSFLVDVGFQGDIVHDIREATGTENNDDILLVKSDLKIHPEIRGFYEGSTDPEWDENIKMGHLIEDDFPKTVLPIDELSPVRGGRLPKYQIAHNNDWEIFLAHMTYQYLKKSIEKGLDSK